jgi:hypothetical protein
LNAEFPGSISALAERDDIMGEKWSELNPDEKQE